MVPRMLEACVQHTSLVRDVMREARRCGSSLQVSGSTAQGTSFTIKGVPGASVEFKLDSSGAAVSAVLTQGGATINLKKK